MVKTRGVEHATEKWARKVAVAGPDYQAGIADPKKDWKTETAAAEPRYEEGVRGGIADKRFGKGVARAGTEKWSRKATSVGVDRWSPGVAAATEDYNKGMGVVISAIEGVTLPPRYPAGDPRNYERVKAIGTAVSRATRGR